MRRARRPSPPRWTREGARAGLTARRARASPSPIPTGTLARPVCIVEQAATDAGLDRLLRIVEREAPERIVVGMPLTLRGEHGEQAQRDGRVRRSAARAGGGSGRDVRRAIHERPRRRRRREGSRAPALGLPRVVERRAHVRRLALVLAACRARARGLQRRRRSRPPPRRRLRHRRSRSGSSFPRASRAATWPTRITAVDAIARDASGTCARGCRHARTCGATAGKPCAFAASAASGIARGLPLPGDVRLLQEHAVEDSSSATSSRRSARTGRR